MDGNFKSIKTIIIFLFIISSSCKKREKVITYDSQEIIKYNISILLDSLEHFDWTRIPIPKKFKPVKKQDLGVELIDSIIYEKNTIGISLKKINKRFNNKSNYNFQRIKLDRTFIQNLDLRNMNFKDINLVKKNSNSIFTLTVVFSNFLIDDTKTHAGIVVTKKIGISMKKDIYFFEKKGNKWICIGRENIGIG